jgi:hypothetical protein
VFVVPKSSPSARFKLTHDLHAGLRVLVAQLLLDLDDRLLQIRRGQECVLELVFDDVLLPGRALVQLLEDASQ